jgi:NADH-quinone oxidoreductase subunit N
VTFDPRDLSVVALDLMVALGILVILVLDLFVDAPKSKRALGYATALLLAGVFAASFFVDTSGTAFSGAYVGGEWTLFFTRAFLGAGVLATLGSVEHVAARQPHRQGEYYLLLLFSLLGMMLLPGARDLILLVVCFELMGIPLFVLAAFEKSEAGPSGRRDTAEGAFKFYLVGVVSTAITLFGLSLVYGASGTTSIAALATLPAAPLTKVGMLMLIGGMGFKIGVVPFHMWVPDTYQGTSTPFVAFLSVAPKIAGIAALASLFFLGFVRLEASWVPVVLLLSLLSMVIGNVLAVTQTNVKRLLGYSGISHMGYMLMAFACLDQEASAMILFYAVGYVVTNIGAFVVVQAVALNGGDDTIDSFNGLGRRSPYLALAMLLFLLSLAGIPFVVGFWAKLYVFLVAWKAGLEWLVVIGAVLAVVALFYYLQIARAMYMKPPAAGAARPKTGVGLRLAIAGCLLGVVGFGLWPSPIIDGALDAATSSPLSGR